MADLWVLVLKHKQTKQVQLSDRGGWEMEKSTLSHAVWQPVSATDAHSERQPHFVKLLQCL